MQHKSSESRMKTIAVASLACLVSTGCTFFMGRTVATVPTSSTEASAAPAAKLSHDRLCSQLRADISSGQHNQRTTAPATNTPIIAAASEGKEDQKIEALRQRYSDMGCVGTPPPASSSPTH
jgi:hypothetical protein